MSAFESLARTVLDRGKIDFPLSDEDAARYATGLEADSLPETEGVPGRSLERLDWLVSGSLDATKALYEAEKRDELVGTIGAILRGEAWALEAAGEDLCEGGDIIHAKYRAVNQILRGSGINFLFSEEESTALLAEHAGVLRDAAGSGDKVAALTLGHDSTPEADAAYLQAVGHRRTLEAIFDEFENISG